MPILEIKFPIDMSYRIKNRIEYSFKTFCAVYGYEILLNHGIEKADLTFYYGDSCDECDVQLAALYQLPQTRCNRVNPVFVTCENSSNNEIQFPCFHGVDTKTKRPDWLAEIFEWISGAIEIDIESEDDIGRVPFSETPHKKFELQTEVPYANLAMREFNFFIISAIGQGAIFDPINVNTNGGLSIVSTHDLDHLPHSALLTTRRLIKNIGIALVAYKDLDLAIRITVEVLKGILRRRSPLDNVENMLTRQSMMSISSSYYLICRNSHRRDADYSLATKQITETIHRIIAAGAEAGVHGSYESLLIPDGLKQEYKMLRDLGVQAVGGRQHWLRYKGIKLFEELEKASAIYDCSVGYSETCGFRSGAAFPYVPYNFQQEKPFKLLEFPLVIMDSALFSMRKQEKDLELYAKNILKVIREFGWGGVSILWHNTGFGGGQFPKSMGDLYWKLKEDNDAWVSGKEMCKRIWERYQKVGLLPHLSIED